MQRKFSNTWSTEAVASIRLSVSAAGPRLPQLGGNKPPRGAISAKAGLNLPSRGRRDSNVTIRRGSDETPAYLRKRKSHHKFVEEPEEKEATPPPTPVPAWSQFSDHVKVISRSDLFLGEKKEVYSGMSSADHKTTLSDLRVKNMRKQAKAMVLKVTAVDGIKESSRLAQEELELEYETEVESEDEEVVAERERRRATARQHWGIVRGYVQDRIQQRKKRNSGFNQKKAFNKLRAQAKASLNPEQARRELFERYGIIPKPGKLYPEDSMKPIFSHRAHDIIAKFEQIQVINLFASTSRPKSYAAHRQRQKELRQMRLRPKTSSYSSKSAVSKAFR